MTRGYEPYEDEYFDPDHGVVVVNRLQVTILPNLGEDRLDQII